jgi:hypothetical protein
MTDLRWFTCDREQLAEVLLWCDGPLGSTEVQPSGIDSTFHGPVIGFVSDSIAPYPNPKVVLLPDQIADNTLSWLRTFAPRVFPISLYSRVAPLSDWIQFSRSSPATLARKGQDAWGSVVLAEALLHHRSSTDIGGLALNRTIGSTTYAFARALHLHGNAGLALAGDRLAELESDSWLVRRVVPIDELMPLVDILLHVPPETRGNVESTVWFVLTAGLATLNRDQSLPFNQSPEVLHPGLYSASAEERISAFRETLDHLEPPKDPRSAAADSLRLAAAAMLAGRSTSHSFLVRREVQRYPTALLWYGLMAGLVGPASWDDDWWRATRGIERNMLAEFDWSSPVGADLCWSEYKWLRKISQTDGPLSSLPSAQPAVLTIEVIPGAVTQRRLKVAASDHDPASAKSAPSQRELDLQHALDQFIRLALRTMPLVEDPSPRSSSQSDRRPKPSPPPRTRRKQQSD